MNSILRQSVIRILLGLILGVFAFSAMAQIRKDDAPEKDPYYIVFNSSPIVLQLSDKQKIDFFGSSELFHEDSLLRVWRRQMLLKLKDISFAQQIFGGSLLEYAKLFPTDKEGITSRFRKELKESAPYNDRQIDLIIAWFWEEYLKLNNTDTRLFLMVREKMVMQFSPVSLLGTYYKNKQYRVDWLKSRASDALYSYYINQQKISRSDYEKELSRLLLSYKE